MKKLLSVMLCLLMLVSFVSTGIFGITAHAATNGVQTALDKVKSVYNTGAYFTVSGGACASSNHDIVDGNYCSGCYLQSIPSRGGLPAGASLGWTADTCHGFALYVYYCVFGSCPPSMSSWSKTNGFVIGDIIRINNYHTAIYIGEDANNYYVYDANGYNGKKNKVVYSNYWPKSNVTSVEGYHAPNYDKINSSSSSLIQTTKIQPGNYFIRNTGNDNYLNVSYGKDEDKNSLHLYEFGNYNSQVYNIYESCDGYEMMPACSQTRVVNPYSWTVESGTTVNLYSRSQESSQCWKFEAVGDGYVIRNAQNPTVCLTPYNYGMIVSEFTGADNQIWYLEKACIIKYDAVGGSGVPTSHRVRAGYQAELSGQCPIKNGHRFLGWSTTKNSATPSWSEGATVTIYEDTTFYAVWKHENGWVTEGGKWYKYENGVKVTNAWRKDSKGWVCLGADGAMLTNKWCKDSKGWCYVGADGYAVTNCWKKDSHGWIYLDANGSMTKSKWIKDNGKWYYLDAQGYMLVNKWQKDSKGWVYVGADGAMKTNAWVKDSKGWCYVGADGYAVTNCWKKDSHGWIYLDANGSMTKSKWVKDSGKWYYCDASGYMVANKSLKIGNKTYKFNASGVCTNP